MQPALLASFVLLLAMPAPGGGGGGDLAWEAEWGSAFSRAGAESKVVFLAVNMDGERANDELAERTYTDDDFIALTAHSVNLIASRDEHAAAGKPCKRFPGVTCEQHAAVEAQARADVLKPGPDGAVLAPQHVFLDPRGAVILSVPYAVHRQELEWCLVTAIRAVDPESRVALPSGARPPKRLIMGGVLDLGGGGSRPLNEEELEEAIRSLRASTRNVDLQRIQRILATDHPEAIEFTEQQMGDVRLTMRPEMRQGMIRSIGRFSPPGFWVALRRFLTDRELEVRCEAAAAIEQLGAEDAAKDLKALLKKEKEPRGRQALLRALGACGAADKSARKTILKAARSDRIDGVRRAAMLALGSHASDDEVAELLTETLSAAAAEDRQAAALAIAFSRDPRFAAALGTAHEKELDETTRAVLGRARSVLDGENLSLVRDDFLRAGGDGVPRPRFFGS